MTTPVASFMKTLKREEIYANEEQALQGRELTRHAADSAQRASKKEAAAESTRAQRDLGDVAVRMEQITLLDIRVRCRGSQDNHGNALQRRTLLDFLQDLATIFLRKVQIEQDQIRAGSIGVALLAPKKSHCLCPI